MGNISKISTVQAALNRQSHRVLVKSVAEAHEWEGSMNAADVRNQSWFEPMTHLCGKVTVVFRQKQRENGLQILLGRCFGKDFAPLEQHDPQGQGVHLTYSRIC